MSTYIGCFSNPGISDWKSTRDACVAFGCEPKATICYTLWGPSCATDKLKEKGKGLSPTIPTYNIIQDSV